LSCDETDSRGQHHHRRQQPGKLLHTHGDAAEGRERGEVRVRGVKGSGAAAEA
jgi:hypothetical protein